MNCSCKNGITNIAVKQAKSKQNAIKIMLSMITLDTIPLKIYNCTMIIAIMQKEVLTLGDTVTWGVGAAFKQLDLILKVM